MDRLKDAIARFVEAHQEARRAAEAEGEELPPVIVLGELEADEDDEG